MKRMMNVKHYCYMTVMLFVKATIYLCGDADSVITQILYKCKKKKIIDKRTKFIQKEYPFL